MSAPSDSPESTDPLESPSDSPSESTNAAADRAESPDAPATVDSVEGPESTANTPACDPRMNDEYVRDVSGPEYHDLTLVGVVHDHPASVYRAGAVVRERDPESVALEVPPLATPLYRAYARDSGTIPDRDSQTSSARDSQTHPSFGGEMSAAVQAARGCDAEVVGIDAPTPTFLERLARNCLRERASVGTLRRVAAGVASVTQHAVVCRAAAAVADQTSLRVEVDDPVAHDCGHADPPEVQARDEREQASRSQSLLRALDPPQPVQLRDETREECMAERLESLRTRGETVAIVGLDHLDGIAEQLKE